MPKPNETYRREHCTFRIHYVGNGQVYMLKRDPRGVKVLIRVTMNIWNRQMKGAKPLGRNPTVTLSVRNF